MKKTARILIRVSDADKERLRLAAQADRRTISDFMLRAALADETEAPTTRSRRRK